MEFVFSFLVFFVLFLAGTFDAEPLLVLWGGGEDPHTRPGTRRTDGGRGGVTGGSTHTHILTQLTDIKSIDRSLNTG